MLWIFWVTLGKITSDFVVKKYITARRLCLIVVPEQRGSLLAISTLLLSHSLHESYPPGKVWANTCFLQDTWSQTTVSFQNGCSYCITGKRNMIRGKHSQPTLHPSAFMSWQMPVIGKCHWDRLWIREYAIHLSHSDSTATISQK